MVIGDELPVAFPSLTKTWREKILSAREEGLAITFTVKKFHNYNYGCHFTIESDHQPRSFLFRELKGIPVLANSHK